MTMEETEPEALGAVVGGSTEVKDVIKLLSTDSGFFELRVLVERLRELSVEQRADLAMILDEIGDDSESSSEDPNDLEPVAASGQRLS